MNFKESYNKLGNCVNSIQNIDAKIQAKTRYEMLDDNVDNYCFGCSSLTDFKVPANLSEAELNEKLEEAVFLDVIGYFGSNCDKKMLDSVFKASLASAKSMCYFEKRDNDNIFIIYEDGRAFVCDNLKYKDENKKNIAVQDCFKFSYNNGLNEQSYHIVTDITNYTKMPLGLDDDLSKQYPCTVTVNNSTQYLNDKKIYYKEATTTSAIYDNFNSTTEEKVSCRDGVNVEYKKTEKLNNVVQNTVTMFAQKEKSQDLSLSIFEDRKDDLTMDC